MVESVILATRAAPDWAGLARDHAEGHWIDPARYLPPHHRRFPVSEVPALYERWNRYSAISFYACRHRLREIATSNHAQVGSAMRTHRDELPATVERLRGASFVVFYHDDDDWFHPELVDAIRDVDVEAVDAIVFPFIRLHSDLLTFTRDGVPTTAALGRFAPFRFRYCTNNYGLTPRALMQTPAELIEHIDASEAADALGFVDAYVDTIVSATNKTPCSVSWLRELPDDEGGFNRYITNYVVTLEAIELPPGAKWLSVPLRETIELFRRVVA